MNTGIKIALYVAFMVGACLFGYFAYANYSQLMTESAEGSEQMLADIPALESEAKLRGTHGYATILTYGGLFLAMLLGLGLLVGHDVSSYLGTRALKSLFNEEGEGIANPEYEIAEQEWADGHHLEAIRLMREYLNKNPREQYVAIRIAEIYEKDLKNPLAAALEYEEVLKKKLAPERWGWAAIHLCNLYNKLNQQEKSVALLRRIDSEYGETAAAEKARKRLSEVDPGFQPAQNNSPAEPALEAEPQPPSDRQLPPGFAPRK